MPQSPVIIDLHCDLLSYMAQSASATAFDTEIIGCAVPHLQAGRVKLQTMALFAFTKAGSAEFGMQQAMIWRKLMEEGTFTAWNREMGEAELLADDDVIYAIPSLESASGFAEEDESLSRSLARLEQLMALVGRPLYLSLTHHPENRFGGGNKTTGVGLKPDGKELLDYLSGRGIAIDLSHTSDALAHGIMDHIDAKGLDLRLLASHSNFREVQDHNRNLPDELALELLRRKGLVGINFVRDFMGPDDPNKLFDHVRKGLDLGLGDCLAWGADFFPPSLLPAEMREYRDPIFHPEHEDASKYPGLLDQLKTEVPALDQDKFCWGNALRFLQGK